MKWDQFVWVLLHNANKYFLIAGSIFLIYYIFLTKRISKKKIQKAYPNKKDYWREIFFSTLSIIIFSFPPLFMLYNDSIQPYTTFYTDISEYGWVYSILAFPLMLLVHDSIHLTLFFIFSFVYNVYGHLGFELYPKGFNRRWLGKYLNTSTWHNQHPIF